MNRFRFAIFFVTVAAIQVASAAEQAHFHHIGLNSTNPDATIEFYTRHLSANRVKYHGAVDAVYTERSFFLIDKVDTPPPSLPTTAISHIGWSGKDGPSEYEWLKGQGIEFHTPVTALGTNYYMYFYGVNRELLEIYTGGQHHRFNHIHLYATDVNVTAQWFVDHLGLEGRGARPRPDDPNRIWSNGVRSDNVGIVIFAKPVVGGRLWEDEMTAEFEPTKGHAIDHIAYSYRDIEPVFARLKGAGVEIATPIATDPVTGVSSFFVLAPDKLLVEIVQEKPIPEGIWE